MSFDTSSLPDLATRRVTCNVTAKIAGAAVVRAYDYDGIEKPPKNKRCYRVPLYVATLDAEGTADMYQFAAVRFGMVIGHRGDYMHATAAGDYDLIWQDLYMRGSGAWRLLQGTRRTNALIHDGADYPNKQAWGAAGCIEITGRIGGRDAWDVFNQRVRELSGIPADWERLDAHKLIQKNQSFRCVLHRVAKPRLEPVACP